MMMVVVVVVVVVISTAAAVAVVEVPPLLLSCPLRKSTKTKLDINGFLDFLQPLAFCTEHDVSEIQSVSGLK
jgi:hypothetical protein